MRYEAAKKLLKEANPNGKPTEEQKKVTKAQMLLDDLEAQAAMFGVETADFIAMIEALSSGNNGALMQTIVEEMTKEKLEVDDLYQVILEREIREEMREKEADKQAGAGADCPSQRRASDRLGRLRRLILLSVDPDILRWQYLLPSPDSVHMSRKQA